MAFTSRSAVKTSPCAATLARETICSNANSLSPFRLAMPAEEGTFAYLPDGRLQFQVTAGKNAGQRGENRIDMQGQSFSMHDPSGSCVTFTRMAAPQTQPGPGVTPLEGRWICANPGPVIFSYVFSEANTSPTDATAPSCRAAPSR